MRSLSIATSLVLFATCVGSAFGADRYVYYDGSAAHYCDPPAQPREHCYVVRDEPNVVRVNGHPVMSSERAHTLCSAHPTPTKCCDPTPNTNCHCLPRITKHCACKGDCNDTPISCPPGKLEEKCEKDYFYKAICVIEGTIPVPKICVKAVEEYQFRDRTLDYNCDDPVAPGEGCEDVDCDHEDCKGPCRIKSCEVYNKREYCEKTCEMCPRKGKLLMAIRRDGRVADVFIGTVGQPFFPEYPRNLVVIRGRSESVIRRLLQNPNISFAECCEAGSGDRNLLPYVQCP